MRLFKLIPVVLHPAARTFSGIYPRQQFRFSSMASHTCRALVVREKNGKNTLVAEDISVPQPGPHQALIKVAVAAQNPTDVLCFDAGVFGDGSVLGCDFAGTVAAIGSEVTRIQQGDKIAGLIWGGQVQGQGAYSEYAIADENICYKIPDGMPLEQAATVPLAAATAWMALFGSKSLHIDRTKGSSVQLLIWAGSTSVGLYAVQLAALFGFSIATVCSPRHFPLLRSFGAKHVFNYKDPEVISKIQQALPDVQYVFDTIGNETSSATASKAICASGGTLCTVRPFRENTENVTPQTKVTSLLVFTAFLRDQHLGSNFLPASLAGSFCGQPCHDLPLTCFRPVKKITSLLQSSMRSYPSFYVKGKSGPTIQSSSKEGCKGFKRDSKLSETGKSLATRLFTEFLSLRARQSML
ncbi:hypothetical protein AK830_g4456 [Neonectria ditissima]|uniref:Enoyl reductase (ER) domain-containing protein n=1 Tax=Neonectria ditissima TaxID=78410 RepID=A0A0P7BND3_9HYPO|nr:hypothetical protein AK830_g4456 [Neonectria ditissima]